MTDIAPILDDAFERRAEISPGNVDPQLKSAIQQALEQLDSGAARVAEKVDGEWRVHQWLKKAVLLSFRIEDNVTIDGGYTRYYDKVPAKFALWPGRFALVAERVIRRPRDGR